MDTGLMMNRKGFTLIEVLVALAVLAVGLLAVAQMSYMYVRANIFNSQMSVGTIAAQQKMEQLRALARSDRTDKYSPFDFDYLISTEPEFTSVMDGTGNEVVISGYCSGSTGGLPYEMTTDDRKFDVLALDAATGEYFMEDDPPGVPVQGVADTFWVTRRWSVVPILDPVTNETNFARIQVLARWTDRDGKERETNLSSLVHRRQ